jgi:hypothetical protein
MNTTFGSAYMTSTRRAPGNGVMARELTIISGLQVNQTTTVQEKIVELLAGTGINGTTCHVKWNFTLFAREQTISINNDLKVLIGKNGRKIGYLTSILNLIKI